MDNHGLKWTERFCMECGTFTAHWGRIIQIYCVHCKPVAHPDIQEEVELKVDYDELKQREILCRIGKFKFTLSVDEASSLSQKLMNAVQDVERNLYEKNL